MSNHPRVPLHFQNTEIAKAASKGSDSYETFRPNQIHNVQYREMEDRTDLGGQNRIRRYPNGNLDYDYVKNQLVDTFRKLNYGEPILPVEAALLTVIFPLKFRKMEPQQAEIMTQMSKTEKATVVAMFEAWLKEVENNSAGAGGGSVPGRNLTDVGG